MKKYILRTINKCFYGEKDEDKLLQLEYRDAVEMAGEIERITKHANNLQGFTIEIVDIVKKSER